MPNNPFNPIAAKTQLRVNGTFGQQAHTEVVHMKREDLAYPTKLFLANEDGDYLGVSRRFDVRITDESIGLSELQIPLLKVQKAERLGSGMYLQYVDPNGFPTKLFLTTSDIFGIGRKKKINAFLTAVGEAVTSARRVAPPEQVISAQTIVPPDTCHDCGVRGGAPVCFGTIFSFIVYSQWSTKQGVYCRTHVTDHGRSALLTTGFFGWWSLRGLLYTPIYTVMNISALLRHSTLSMSKVVALGACAFLPGSLLVAFIIYAAKSA